MIPKASFLVAGAAAAALAAAGCGGGGGGGSTTPSSAPAASSTPAPASTGGKTLSLSADPSGALAFDKKTLTAKAGTVTLKMANPSSIPHGIAIQGSGANKTGAVVGHGGTSTVTVTLKPGKYTFYCPVPGHRQGGMVGTLTVQ